jgi:adenylate cyclase
MVKKEKTPLQPHAEKDPAPDAAKIQKQLQRILTSPEFQATDRQRDFLQFVITETIAGRDQEIKGYTVATQVFGRKDDFDQATDPIVSIQANRLRRSLERYYLVAGQQDPVRIDIPKGTYVPTFCEQIGIESDTTARSSKSPKSRFEGSWPSVLVRTFKNLTGDPELNYLTVGLATELAMEITKYQDIRVLMYDPEEHGKKASDTVARFVINGSVRKDRTGIKVAVNLVDTTTNTQIWGDMHRSNLEATQLISFQEEVAQVVAVKIAGEDGIISKNLSIESKNIPPSDLKTYEAMLRYHEFNMVFSGDTFLRALEALKGASVNEPECGLIWAMLGRLYAENYSLELMTLVTPLEEAIGFAEKGVYLNPDNQRARVILAFARLFSNEVPAGLVEVERALALNPNSLFFMDNIGYLFTLFGDWERGPALIRKAIKLNPYYNTTVHYALWVDWVQQEKYQQAYLETLNFRKPMLFWDPLIKAATFGLLGRYEEGRRAAEELLKLKPDFPSRGRILIKHYIKFEDIVERTIDGLSKCGLNIE